MLQGVTAPAPASRSPTLTLFHIGGHILVGGVDISSLPLKKLRTGLSIIPRLVHGCGPQLSVLTKQGALFKGNGLGCMGTAPGIVRKERQIWADESKTR